MMVLGGLLGKSESTSEKTYRDLGVYSEVLNRIRMDYVTEPNLKKVTDGAIRGPSRGPGPLQHVLYSQHSIKTTLKHPDPGPAECGHIPIQEDGLCYGDFRASGKSG